MTPVASLRSRMGPARRAAFTLVEVLVVISLIALLVALLLPVLGRARKAAQVSQALSQGRQITLALHLYADTSNSSMPYCLFFANRSAANNGFASTVGNAIVGDPNYNPNFGYSWAGKLVVDGLIEDPKAFWSPARDNRVITPTIWRAMTSQRHPTPHTFFSNIGYGINAPGVAPVEQKPTTNTSIPLRVGQARPGQRNFPMPPPSQHLLLTEMWRTVTYPVTPGIDGWHIASNTLNNNAFTYDGQAVRTYVDGSGAARDSRDLGWTATTDRDGSWTTPPAAGAPWFVLQN